ncbi:MAG: hypothetical protein H7X95_02900 [Deltaproteobacteria bacterium]|nr:hypothetical protein [Deltaproteobacteria bacterium]
MKVKVRSLSIVLIMAGSLASCLSGQSADESFDPDDVHITEGAATAPKVGRPLPTSAGQASGSRYLRMDNIVSTWVQRYLLDRDKSGFAEHFGFEPYTSKGNAKAALRKIAAGFYALKYAANFSHFPALLNDRPRFRTAAENYMKFRLVTMDGVGTDYDYDMILKEMLTLLVSFSEEVESATGKMLISNDIIWSLICQNGPYGGCNNASATGKASWSGQELNRRGKIVGGALGNLAETENHSLMIHSWRYLVNDYVKWAGSLNPTQRRYDARIAALYQSPEFRASYDNQGTAGQPLVDYLLQMLGRPLHNGIFEQNSKAYESLSFHAILNLYMGANKYLQTPSGLLVKAAAKNALELFATKYALQTLEGKRYAPMRRDYGYRRRVGIGNNDYMPDMLGIITSAYTFYDGWNDTRVEAGPTGATYSKSRYNAALLNQKDAAGNGWELDGAAGHALWAALFEDDTKYTMPSAIHDLALNKHQGYFLRMKTLFTRETSSAVGHYGTQQNPEYFRGNVAWTGGALNTSPEFYFVTNDFMNVAGGHWQQYFDRAGFWPASCGAVTWGSWDETCQDWKFGTNTYNWNSVPYAVIPRGDVGRGWGRNGEDFGAMQQEVPIMIGHHTYPHESRNIWTYKNFSYGYTHAGGTVDRHTRWPQLYPTNWATARSFQINRASFRIIDLRSTHGFYMVMSLVSKSNTSDGQLYEYGRGFWEVIPGSLSSTFPDVASVEARIRAYNPTTNFPNYDNSNNGTKHYWYKLAVSGDTIKLDQKGGSSASCQAIMEIKDHNGTALDLGKEHTNFCSDSVMRAMPLIEAREVDSQYRFTGRKYAHGAGNGVVRICNPFVNQMLVLDSSTYSNPSQRVEATNDCRF